MPKYIAVVTVATHLDGKRQEFAPGSELPELPEHDIKSLLELGAIKDPEAEARADKAEAAAERKAGRDFRDARRAQQAAQASTATSDAPDASKGSA